MAIISLSGRAGSGKDLVAKIIQYLITKVKFPSIEFGEDPFLYDTGFGDLATTTESESGWKVQKFAHKLKQTATLLTGVPIENWEDQDFKKLEMPPEWDQLKQVSENEPDEKGMSDGYLSVPMTYREFLQRLGTEAIRDGLHRNTWVNALFADYRPLVWTDPDERTWNHPEHQKQYPVKDLKPVYPNWIISDLRFPNEFEAIKERGGICVRIDRPFEEFRYGDNEIKMKVNPIFLHSSETALDSHTFDYVLSNSGTIEDLIETVRKMLIHFKLLEDATNNSNTTRP